MKIRTAKSEEVEELEEVVPYEPEEIFVDVEDLFSEEEIIAEPDAEKE